MKKIKDLGNDGFFSLLALLLTFMIICFMAYGAFQNYYSKSPKIDQSTRQDLSTQGINTQSYQSVLDSTRTKLKDITKQENDRLKKAGF